MSHGFPAGKFRILHVQTQRYLFKRGGSVHSADTSATYDAPGGSSAPEPGLRAGLKKSADEVWSYDDGGRLVSAVEEDAGRGSFALRAFETGGVSMIGTGSLYGARWEFADGFIKVRDRDLYLSGSDDDDSPWVSSGALDFADVYRQLEDELRTGLRLLPSDEIPEMFRDRLPTAPDMDKVVASQKWELKKA